MSAPKKSGRQGSFYLPEDSDSDGHDGHDDSPPSPAKTSGQRAPLREASRPSTASTTTSQDDAEDRPLIYQDPTEGQPGRERVRKTRIKDRAPSDKKSGLKIKIELDLEVELNLYARVKGDVTISLM